MAGERSWSPMNACWPTVCTCAGRLFAPHESSTDRRGQVMRRSGGAGKMNRTSRSVVKLLAVVCVCWCAAEGTAAAAISSTNTTNDASNAKYVFQYGTPGNFYRTYLDTDVNAGTGFAIAGIGADYLLEDGLLWRYVG